jgi:hypothetical protein
MNEQSIIAYCVGAALILTGCLLMTSRKVAAWGLSHGNASIWVRLLGEARAMLLTRYFFGPLVFLMGLGAIAMGWFGR